MSRGEPDEAEARDIVEAIYVRYLPIMEKVAKTCLVDKSAYEDVISDCAEKLIRLTVHETIRRQGVGDGMSALLAFMVKNRAYDYNRRLLRERQLFSQSAFEDLTLTDPAPMPEELALSNEKIYGTLFRLSETDQKLIMGRYFQGATDEELARELGCKPSSIRPKLKRARDRFKKIAEELDDEEV